MHLFRSTFELDASGTTRRRPREEKVSNLLLLSTNSGVLCYRLRAAILREKAHFYYNTNLIRSVDLVKFLIYAFFKSHSAFCTMLAEICLTLSSPQRPAGMVVYAPQPARC